MRRSAPARLPKGISLHKATGSYFGRIVVQRPDGTKARVSTPYFTSVAEASYALRRIGVEAASLDPSRVTMSSFLAEWMAWIAPVLEGRTQTKPHVRPATYSNRLRALAPLLPAKIATGKLANNKNFEMSRSMLIRDFDARALRLFLDRLTASGVGSRSRQLAYEYLRAAWPFAIRQQYVLAAASPFATIERPDHKATIRESLTEAEMGKLQAACGSVKALRTRVLLTLLVTSGPRISEALGLQWEHVNFERGEVRIRQQLGENRKPAPLKTMESSREVWPVPEVMKGLVELKALAKSPWVFETPRGGPLDRNNVRTKMLHPVLERAGLACRVTVHDLRSIAATLAANDMDAVALCQMFGWSKLSTAQKFYLKATDTRREAGRAAAMKGMERAARAARTVPAG